VSGVLSELFGGIESGNDPNVGASSTGALGQYQQFLPFQEQFGANTTGSVITDPVYQEAALENFAGQATTANPGLSVGDLYAEYNRGTGTPGSGATFDQLPGSVQTNFTNNAAALGLTADTPASNVVSGVGGGLAFSAPGVPNTGGGVDDPGLTDALGAAQDPSFSDPLYDPGTGAVASYGANDPLGLGAAAQNALTGDPVTGAPADTSTSTDVLPALGANITDWLTRGGLVLLGIVLVAAAAWALASGERRGQIVSAVNRATAPPPVFGAS
jgi:hypothetical protein